MKQLLLRIRRSDRSTPTARKALLMAAATLAVALPLSQSRSIVTRTAAAANVNWRFYGNDLANTRFQNVDLINPTNVGSLQVAWVFHTGVLDPKAELEVSPIVIDGVMYVTDGHDDVFALDAATGRQIWAYKPTELPNEMPPLSRLSICCGRANRGVAFGNGKVFVGRLDDVLVALDAKTGTPVWKATVVEFVDRFSITAAPQFVNGLVIIGASGGEFEVRGQLVAYDADTGAERWRFFTTQPGTWAGHSWLTGGATNWTTPPVDRNLGLVYVTTGNAAPDINGVQRAGDNLFSASIVALDVTTGQPVWHFQETHHDLWDYDSTQPAVLFPVRAGGTTVPAIGHCSKNGNYYILDRRDGRPIFPVTERPVPVNPAWQHPSPTQPVSAVEPLTPLTFVPGTIDFRQLPPGVLLAPQYTPPQQQELLIVPGDDGGCEWSPAAFSPRTGFVYYGTRYEPSTFQTSPDNQSFLGSTFEESVPGVKGFGIFGATDTRTGKVVWKSNVDQPAKSGMLVAGDLVFFGEGNGKFHGVHGRTGSVLFSFDGTTIPNGGGAQAAPVAYVVNGREFIANAFGGNVPDRGHFPPNPVGDAIVAFAVPQ